VHFLIDAGLSSRLDYAGIMVDTDDRLDIRPEKAEELPVPAADIEHRLRKLAAAIGGVFPSAPEREGRETRIELRNGFVATQDVFLCEKFLDHRFPALTI
jgi:hypothetical protein